MLSKRNALASLQSFLAHEMGAPTIILSTNRPSNRSIDNLEKISLQDNTGRRIAIKGPCE